MDIIVLTYVGENCNYSISNSNKAVITLNPLPRSLEILYKLFELYAHYRIYNRLIVYRAFNGRILITY